MARVGLRKWAWRVRRVPQAKHQRRARRHLPMASARPKAGCKAAYAADPAKAIIIVHQPREQRRSVASSARRGGIAGGGAAALVVKAAIVKEKPARAP